jgi:hypothetical protein
MFVKQENGIMFLECETETGIMFLECETETGIMFLECETDWYNVCETKTVV